MIDYRTTRFEEMLRDVDVVLDTIGGDTLERSSHSPPTRRDARLRRGFTSSPSRAGRKFVEIARLIDAGQIRPVLDAVLPLARAQ